MIRVLVRTSLVAGLSLSIVGCDLWPFGPSGSVGGNWHFTSGKSFVFEMSLTQSGDDVSGTACGYVLGFIGSAPVSTSPVTGVYPYVRFTDPFVGTCTYQPGVQVSPAFGRRCIPAGGVAPPSNIA